jgi:polysaccharide export outer membrane protein
MSGHWTINWTHNGRFLLISVAAVLSGACSSLGSTGPSSRAINRSAGTSVDSAPIAIVDVDGAVAARLAQTNRAVPFSQLFGDGPAEGTVVGVGDQLSVQIFEAPPAVLFGGSLKVGGGAATAMPSGNATSLTIPTLLVEPSGTIPIPFAGNIRAAGRTPAQIASEIRSRLAGKAHEPHAIVTLAQNNNSTVSVVGDVKTNARVPLTPHGERVLEVLAGAGGVQDQVSKTMIQISRDGQVTALPMSRIISDPGENIRLRSNDIVTAMSKTLSFISLGAGGKNDEVEFEATGISLAQALGRIGGLKDDRANVRGVFIFRFEKPDVAGVAANENLRTTSDGRVPVIYRVDMSRPETLFMAQAFPVRDKDVLFVSSAPLADLQKFVSILTQTAFSFINISNQVTQ